MEETKNNFLKAVQDLLQKWGLDPWMAAGGLALVLLLLIMLLARRKPRAGFPGLVVHLFQIAPLGRDAFLKIRNPDKPVVLSQYRIIGRTDIEIKNHLAGHRLGTGEQYSMLLEATGLQRLEADFTLELTYMDDTGAVFQQRLLPGQQRVEAPKRL